jgi:hypothetical protein
MFTVFPCHTDARAGSGRAGAAAAASGDAAGDAAGPAPGDGAVAGDEAAAGEVAAVGLAGAAVGAAAGLAQAARIRLKPPSRAERIVKPFHVLTGFQLTFQMKSTAECTKSASY